MSRDDLIKHLVECGRKGGQSKSKAKLKAIKANLKKANNRKAALKAANTK